MKQTLLLTLIVFSVVLIFSCQEENPVLNPPGYAYLITDAFSVDTSQWGPGNNNFTWTLRLRNIGTLQAKYIMTQLDMKDSVNMRTTPLQKWWTIGTDTVWDVIPPGGTLERTFADTFTYRGPSVPPFNWRPSYLANPYNNIY